MGGFKLYFLAKTWEFSFLHKMHTLKHPTDLNILTHEHVLATVQSVLEVQFPAFNPNKTFLLLFILCFRVFCIRLTLK